MRVANPDAVLEQLVERVPDTVSDVLGYPDGYTVTVRRADPDSDVHAHFHAHPHRHADHHSGAVRHSHRHAHAHSHAGAVEHPHSSRSDVAADGH